MNNNKKILNSIPIPILSVADRGDKKKLLMLIQNIEREEPFTAFGLFNVNMSTLSGVLGTIATYTIVLVQFNFCKDVTSQYSSNGTGKTSNKGNCAKHIKNTFLFKTKQSLQ